MRERKPTIIAFCGQAGAGKSTAREIAKQRLGQDAGRLFSFARLLKNAAFDLALPTLGGRTTNAAFFGSQVEKETPLDAFGGRTGREFLQELGSLCREYNEDFFVNPLRVAVGDDVILIDDCRYPNEAEAVKELGGIVVGVRVSGEKMADDGHESEATMAREFRSMCDYIIEAERGDLESLEKGVEAVLEIVRLS